MMRTQRPRALRKAGYLLLAYSCIATGALGVILPLLPTTPFLIIAAWAAPKASPSLDRWLHRHRRFGPLLAAWRLERAVPSHAKTLACALLLSSWVILLVGGATLGVLLATGIFFVSVALYLLTRPKPSSSVIRSACHESH